MTNFSGGAITPYLTASKAYPFTLLYGDEKFLVSCGEDEGSPNLLSVGVRWYRNRGEADTNAPNPSGFPRGCWLMLPNDCLTISFLRTLIGTQAQHPDRDGKIVWAINKLIEQQNSQAKE